MKIKRNIHQVGKLDQISFLLHTHTFTYIDLPFCMSVPIWLHTNKIVMLENLSLPEQNLIF